MKMNWTIVKVALALVIALAAVVWGVSQALPINYSGTNLDFAIASGSVSVTNRSDQRIPAQVLGTGTSTFRVASTTDEVSGSSTREGSGRSATQSFTFDLPPGTTTFTVTRGTNLTFVASGSTNLRATVNPVSEESLSMIAVIATVVVLIALYFASSAVEHRWIKRLLPQSTKMQDATTPASTAMTGGEGRAAVSFGDNRAKK